MLEPLNRKLHICDQLVLPFVKFYIQLTTSYTATVSYPILYIKKYGADITKIDTRECNHLYTNMLTYIW